MSKKDRHDKFIEVVSTKRYSSVLLTPKEYRKGRKRWQRKNNT